MERPKHRLTSIDALRGSAALGVVLFHATGGGLHLDRPGLAMVAVPLSFGFAGVFLFFVISGFCIHLRWAHDAALGQMPQVAFVPFWKRRLRRLYPPYFVALTLCLLVAFLARQNPFGSRPPGWDLGLHLTMLHNLDPKTTWTISGVLWTLAVEEQLYLAYFLLLPLRQKLGWHRTLIFLAVLRPIWFALGFFVHRRVGVEMVIAESAVVHWFTWALGALSVEACFGLVSLPRWCYDRRLAAATFALAAACRLMTTHHSSSDALQDLAWMMEHPLWGLGFFVVLNRFVEREARGSSFSCRRFLGGMARVGVFSYSLYLCHQLVFTSMDQLLVSRLGVSPTVEWVSKVVLMAPLSLVFAFGFFWLFERPFLNKPDSNATETAAAHRLGPEVRPTTLRP